MAERRYTLVFYAAVVTAAAATYGVYRVIETTKESARIPTQSVVVAAQDVPEGASLDRMVLTVSDWPVPTVPAGAYASLDSVQGRVTRVAVFKGEPIVPGRLAPAGTGPGIEVKITPGKRAMGVRIDDVSGISGLLQPNSRVDVLVTLRDMTGSSEGPERQVSKLFMENMRVLSVGSQVQRGPDNQPIQAPWSRSRSLRRGRAARDRPARRGDPARAAWLRGPGQHQDAGCAEQRRARPAQRRAAARPAPSRPSRRRVPLRLRGSWSRRPAPAAPPRADSSVVQVFRGDKLSSRSSRRRTPPRSRRRRSPVSPSPRHALRSLSPRLTRNSV
jgi:pilus assembly protein CpaB